MSGLNRNIQGFRFHLRIERNAKAHLSVRITIVAKQGAKRLYKKLCQNSLD